MLKELFIAFNEARHSQIVEYTTGNLQISREVLCPYVSLRAAGCMEAPEYPGSTDNTIYPHDEKVLQRLAEDIARASVGKDFIRWEHVICCYPQLRRYWPKGRLDPITIAFFGDDCLHQTPKAVLPNASIFDAILCEMWVQDWQTGITTQDVYAKAGINIYQWGLLGYLNRLPVYLKDNPTAIEDRIDIIKNGKWSTDFIWAGSWGLSNPARVSLLEKINRGELEKAGISTKIYGVNGFRDGWADDATLLPALKYTMATLNFPHSSIFNARFSEMAYLGIPQIVADKNHEIREKTGWDDRTHYINFDGTLEGLIDAINWCKKNPQALCDIITACASSIDGIVKRIGITPAWYQMLNRMFG